MASVKGIITRSLGGGIFEVKTDRELFLSNAKGALRHSQVSPFVGDCVSVERDGKSSLITAIDERKNLFIRPPVANLDVLFCTLPSKDPMPDLFTLDKLISIAESAKAEPVIIITKADLDTENAQRLYNLYSLTGFSVFMLSVYNENSVIKLSDYIKNNAKDKISAFAGASGAGKSTLINRLFPDLRLATGALSDKISRGKHTTRSVDLYPLSKYYDGALGYLADTPGFTMLDFERFDFFDLDELPYTFREFDDYIGTCKYTKCTHLCEEGCTIVEAVKDGKIASSRHESYKALYSTLKAKPRKSKKV